MNDSQTLQKIEIQTEIISEVQPTISNLPLIDSSKTESHKKLEMAKGGIGLVLPKLKLASASKDLYRPIQYLGAKHRALPIILSKTLEVYKPETYVLDVFSGSTLVSQIYNINYLNVISNDVINFNSAFSITLLNVDRKINDLDEVSKISEKLRDYKLDIKFTRPFEEEINEEKQLLLQRDTEKLLNLYARFPQIGKSIMGDIFSEQTKYIIRNFEKSAFNNSPLIINYYAGTYFGIYQALELDRLRCGIERLLHNGEVSKWQYNFLLTCLLNVSSKIVYTAGKHFAQPIKQENILKTKVLLKRFYDDRLKDVGNEFLKSVKELSLISQKNSTVASNIAYSLPMEHFLLNSTEVPKVSVIYADPPYTAQQYSRFYHIPEVIFDYRYPKLQLVNGKVTSGLYADDRFKSRFCSKTHAQSAFIDLMRLAAKLNSALILSYSSSLSDETGNSRMISLDQIVDLSNKNLPGYDVEIIRFAFDYKQLNSSQSIVKSKNDKEFLIVFKQKL